MAAPWELFRDFFPSIQSPAFSLFSLQLPLLLNFYLKYKWCKLKGPQSAFLRTERQDPGADSSSTKRNSSLSGLMLLFHHKALQPSGSPFRLCPPSQKSITQQPYLVSARSFCLPVPKLCLAPPAAFIGWLLAAVIPALVQGAHLQQGFVGLLIPVCCTDHYFFSFIKGAQEMGGKGFQEVV